MSIVLLAERCEQGTKPMKLFFPLIALAGSLSLLVMSWSATALSYL